MTVTNERARLIREAWLGRVRDGNPGRAPDLWMGHDGAMELVVTRAETEEALAEVFGLRYAVYVEEMGRYRDTADHGRRWLTEPEDDHSWVFAGHLDGEIVATARLTWGGDAGFSERQCRQYHLEPFLAELPPELLGVGERAMVRPALRGTAVLDQLLDGAKSFTEHLGMRVGFGACEPHLLSLYLRMGQRTYAEHNINSSEAGYLIPLVNFIGSVDDLVGVGGATDPETGAPALPSCIRAVLADQGSVTSGLLTDPDTYRAEITHAFAELSQSITAFAGFTEAETQRCIERSNIIHCEAGDRLLKKGGAAHNMFVVLAGMLEVRAEGRTIAAIGPGEVFGEMAFLLEQPRSHSVWAVSDDTRVLSLSDGTLRSLIASDPEIAAKLLLNVSKMLCVRLVRSNAG
jgi:hypothetical protein